VTSPSSIAEQPKYRARRSGLLPGVQGSVAIEYGILLPALLLFVFVIIDAGRLLWTQASLDRAVEAAARCGAIDTNNCATSTQIQNYAAAQIIGLNVAASAFTSATVTCGLQVHASYVFTPSAPLVWAGTISLSASACYSEPPPTT
jgi:Flp pilus assembly protein TadG